MIVQNKKYNQVIEKNKTRMDGLTAKSTYKFYGLQQTLVRATTAKIICNFSVEKFNQSNARIHLMDSK